MQTIADNYKTGQESKKTASSERRAASPGVPADSGFCVSDSPSEVYTISCLENKFELHDLASRILLDHTFHNSDERTLIENKKLPRTSLCHKTALLGGNAQGVSVFKNLDFERSAHFGGLLKCGSVWACPICAEKISHGRTEELQTAFDVWHDLSPGKNNHVMVSFTIPHKIYEELEDLFSSLMDSKRALKKQAPLKKHPLKVWSVIKEQYHIQGEVTGVETNYGGNGWHPHTHDIFFLSQPLTHKGLLQLKDDLTSAWLYACQQKKVNIPNLEHFIRRSIHISISPTAAEYIAKYGADFEKHKDQLLKSWGHAQELTKSHIKRAKGEKGLTPWDMLRLIKQFPTDNTIYNFYGLKWREFVRVTKGRRQLFWSKGFKSFLKSQSQKFAELCEKSDQELSENESGKKELLGIFSAEQWQIILKNKLRGRVLSLALRRPFEDVIQFIYTHREVVQHE